MSLELERKVETLEEELEIARQVIRILYHWKVEGTEIIAKNIHITEEMIKYLH